MSAAKEWVSWCIAMRHGIMFLFHTYCDFFSLTDTFQRLEAICCPLLRSTIVRVRCISNSRSFSINKIERHLLSCASCFSHFPCTLSLYPCVLLARESWSLGRAGAMSQVIKFNLVIILTVWGGWNCLSFLSKLLFLNLLEFALFFIYGVM